MSDLRITIQQTQEQEEPTEPLPTQQPQKVETPVNKNAIKMNMKIRRALDGTIMIFDHKDVDIFVDSKKMKVTLFAKGDFSDYAYASQNRLFEFLVRKGVIDPQSIRGSHVYGSMEAKILKPIDEILVDQIVILNIGKWLEEEKPQMEFDKHYQEFFVDYMTEPGEEDSTELGEVPQMAKKGTIEKSASRRYVGGWRE